LLEDTADEEGLQDAEI